MDAYSLSARIEYPLFARSWPNRSPDVFTHVQAEPEKPIDIFIYYIHKIKTFYRLRYAFSRWKQGKNFGEYVFIKNLSQNLTNILFCLKFRYTFYSLHI